MKYTLYLAALDMSGSYAPLIWAFVITFALTACVTGFWTWCCAPARIQKRLRKDKMGLIELKNEFHLRLRDWILSFVFAFVLPVILCITFYILLHRAEYEGLPLWVMLTTSMMTSGTFFGEYRPMPYGILAAVFVGFFFGQLLGLAFGKKLGAKRVLISSRLRDTVKF